jgi:hypothetical protein
LNSFNTFPCGLQGEHTVAVALANPVESASTLHDTTTMRINLVSIGVKPCCAWNDPGHWTNTGSDAKCEKKIADQHGCEEWFAEDARILISLLAVYLTPSRNNCTLI